MKCQLCNKNPATFRVTTVTLLDSDVRPVHTAPCVVNACQACTRDGLSVMQVICEDVLKIPMLPYEYTMDSTLQYRPDLVSADEEVPHGTWAEIEYTVDEALRQQDLTETFERWENDEKRYN
jgi:hypothetical protein